MTDNQGDSSKHDNEENEYETWTPAVGPFGKFIAWAFLIMIAIVILWMIMQIFTPDGL